MSFVGFEVLIVEIILHVAARKGFGGLVVVFDVIGAEALAGIADIDVVIGDEEIALVALGSLGGKLGDTTLGGGRADLLGLHCGSASESQSKSEQQRGKEKVERGKFPSMRVAIHAEDSTDRVSWIA